MKLFLINTLQKFNSNCGAQLLEYPRIRIRRLLHTCIYKNIHHHINRSKPSFNIITEPRTPLPVVWSPMEKKKTGNLWCDCNGGSRPSAKWGQAVSRTIFQVGLKISGSAGPPRWIRHWFGSEVIVTWPSTTTSPSKFVVIYLYASHIRVNWKLSESGNRSEKKRHWIEVSNYQYLWPMTKEWSKCTTLIQSLQSQWHHAFNNRPPITKLFNWPNRSITRVT